MSRTKEHAAAKLSPDMLLKDKEEELFVDVVIVICCCLVNDLIVFLYVRSQNTKSR